MTRRKNAQTEVVSEGTKALEELLVGDDGGDGFDYERIDWLIFGRVLAGLTKLGALVTLYISTANKRLVVSVRAGSGKRSYDFDSGEEFTQWLIGYEKTLSGLAKKVHSNGTGASTMPQEAKKGGDVTK